MTTEENIQISYVEGKYAGIEDVLNYLHDVRYDVQFTEDDLKTVKKLYRMVSEKFPLFRGE